MLIYGSGVLTSLENGQPVAPPESSSNQVGPGFASVTIMNESPWGLSFVDANTGSYPITPWAVATIPVSPGDSWHITPQESLFISGNYLMPPGVSNSQAQVVAQFSRNATAYTIRELFTISATEITGTTQVSVDTSGGPVDVSGTVDATITNATIDVTGSTVDLATGTTVDISGTVDVTGPVTISGGQGGNVNVSTDTPPQPASSNLTVPPSGNLGSVTLTPPAAATGFVLICVPNGVAEPYFTATGITSGNLYLSTTLALGAGASLVGVVQGDVEQIQFEVQSYPNSSSLTATAAFIAWLFGSGAQQVVNDESQPLWVTASDTSPLPVQGVQGGSGMSVQTSPEGPAYCAYFNVVLAAAGTIGTIAGVAGQRIHIRSLHWLESVVVGMQILDGSTVRDQLSQPANQTSPDYDWHGFGIITGNSLTFHGLGAATFIVTCLYDQY